MKNCSHETQPPQMAVVSRSKERSELAKVRRTSYFKLAVLGWVSMGGIPELEEAAFVLFLAHLPGCHDLVILK